MSDTVKCLIWDLDNTLWNGILMEDPSVRVLPEAVKTLKELDRRGILHSIASRNDEAAARSILEKEGLWEYFLFPQINWGAKALAIERIASDLSLGFDALAFIDDQEFDREEVKFSHPSVRTYKAEDVSLIDTLPEFIPPFTTRESSERRQMYLASIERDRHEQEFEGAREDFLATLGMVMTIHPAGELDLSRAEELTVRTNQLNTTGRTYSRTELSSFVGSTGHLLLVADLEDRFGSYGKIGLAVVDKGPDVWTLRLLLMSCRVMSRGAGSILLNHVMRSAREAGVRLKVEYKPNTRNRMMLVTLRFAGFKPAGSIEGFELYESSVAEVPPPPHYVELKVIGDS